MSNQEKIIETKTCKHCNSSFEITDKDLEFYEKVSPTFGDKKYLIPTPTLCPDCRQQRRLSFRNERSLYKRNCDASGKQAISMYSPDKNYRVYEQKFWWSDNWNPLDYGKDFDFSKSFFQQFDELYKKVPLISLWNINPENSEYNNNCFSLKDSYMSFNSDLGSGVCYSYVGEHCNNVYDCSYIYNSEKCYECFDTRNAYNCFFSNSLENCSNCYFSSDLIGCSFCYGSHSLRNASYFWFGEQKTKEEWQELFSQNHKGENFDSHIISSRKLSLSKPKKNLNISNSENCIGDYISNSKNLDLCFDVLDTENSKFVTYAAFGVKNVYDSNALGAVELGYECNEGGIDINSCCFVKNPIEGLFKSFYSILCGKQSSNLFGCIGLRAKEYCILNKEYSKEEYENLVPKIIEHMISTGEWGEFFPASISPFGYNETLAYEYFPLSKDEVLKKGFNWSDFEPPFPKADKIIKASMLPENILEVPDDILNWAIECEVSGKPFRIVKAELEFYRKHGLPIPKRHPDQRHLDRLALRNPRKLFDRKCDKCGKDIKTTYSPDRKEIVYCEDCYEKEVY